MKIYDCFTFFSELELLELRLKELNEVVDKFGQLADGMQYVHDKGVLHRDLKAQNIFLTKEGTLKIWTSAWPVATTKPVL